MKLTPRQRDVLDLLITGDQNKVIARKLGITDATIKVHVGKLFKKYNVNNRTQLAYRVGKETTP